MIGSAQAVIGRPGRRGTVVPFLALTLVALIGFLALAIDLGMLAVAKTQAQHAADLAALTAARTLSGDSSTTYNSGTATTNAQNILAANVILGQPIQSTQPTVLTLNYGSFDYNQATQTFNANYPATSGVPYTAVQATVTANSLPGAFSSALGIQFLPNVTATAQAVHRPRDIALVMDLSASMRMGTCLGFDFCTLSRTTNNSDTTVPKFGAYSSANAGLIGPSTNQTSSDDSYTISPTNSTSTTNTSYSQIYMNNFYQQNAYASTLVRAFDSYTSTDSGKTWTAPTSGSPQLPSGTTYTTTPGGDAPLFKNGSTSTYAQHVKDAVNGTPRNKWWELDGYSGCTSGSFNNADLGTSSYASGSFNGYTQGPGYYGKTFFIWPPDPRRPLNTGTATSYSTTTADTATINQFLQDFGYSTSSDFTNSAFTTTLASAITLTSSTSITVNSITPFPTAGLPSTTFRILVDSEVMTVTAVGGTGNKTWTVQRHQGGTTAATHLLGATVGLLTGPPLYGIYSSTITSGSQNWPWPNDSGSTLGSYLTSQVYIPVSQATTARLLLTTDAVYQKIMRLYNWNYVVDNYNSAGSGSSYPGTTPCDWRIRFFGTNNNTKLFNTSTGSLNVPGASTYRINYTEILRWLSTSPNPFPGQLRAGRVKYYGSIPPAITGTWPSYGGKDQRFWVEVIDYTLGFRQTAAGVYTDISGMAGYGSDFTWGTASLNSAPSSTQYVNYSDIPLRPNLRCWFGPLVTTDYLQNFNMWCAMNGYFSMQPGDSYEAPIYTCKQAFLAAVNTMESNHPNDWFTVVPFSWPRIGSTGAYWQIAGVGNTVSGRFNCVSCPLGTNYNYAKSALFFPFSTINADGTTTSTEITPYDADAATSQVPSANFVDTPRADGETCFAMALMLCHNQFAVTSSTDNTLRNYVTSPANGIAFPTGMAGGLGRKGAQKVIIFETDGIPNTNATATLTTSTDGTYTYYPIRYDMNKPSTSEYPTATNYTTDATSQVTTQIQTLVTTLKSTYSTSRNPFRLYAIGFGPVFAGANASSAETVLQDMQYWAGTQSLSTTALPSNQIITGTSSVMSANMISAYTGILQNGVQIALIK